METEHTPGPWHYTNQLIFKDGICIAETFSRETGMDAVANARLIAAAPELLAALQEITDGESQCCSRCEGDGELWADGKAHYPSEQRETILCGNCGGSGRLQPENAQDIAQAAISKAKKG